MAEGIEVHVHLTPNPNSMKFATNHTLAQKSLSYADAQAAEADALARKIFDVPGVQRIFIANNCITVTRQDEAAWQELVTQVMRVVREHFSGEDE